MFIFTSVLFISYLPSLSFVGCLLCGVKMYGKVLFSTDSKRLTWRELVHRVLEELGGQATLGDIYDKAEKHPRHLSVPTCTSAVRRRLQEIATPVARGVWRL